MTTALLKCITTLDALHFRKSTNKAYTTLPEHMPPNHLHMHQNKEMDKGRLAPAGRQCRPIYQAGC